MYVTTEENIEKWNYIKVRHFCLKKTSKRIKKQATEWMIF